MTGFNTRIAEVVTTDGRNCKLVKPITYTALDGRVFVMPTGAMTDGASTPQAIWDVLPPFGSWWLAAFLHDCAYQNTLLVVKETGLEKANLSKDDSDSLLKEAMQYLGVDNADIETIYQGVKMWGLSSYKADRE